ncbi:MAG: DNA polymerase III subunit alpha [Acidobacteria bacterium]|nr:DNA polymerase III subunit alpha [Acidobacteriota bacterium]
MSFALGISDFSIGEGIYTAKTLLKLTRRLGYRDLVLWDMGMQGYPKLREALDWAREVAALGYAHEAFEGAGPSPAEFRIHLGCRFNWRGQIFGALPISGKGYGALNRLLTDQAHGREGEPPADCLLLAERREGLDLLGGFGFPVTLLAHPARVQEARAALAEGLPVAAPQVLRFRTPEGLELHRLKRAIAARSTLPRTEALWDLPEAALPRAAWEARFPAAEPAIAKRTEAMLEAVSGWSIPWNAATKDHWVIAAPLGLEGADLEAELERRTQEGLQSHPVKGDATSRLAQELPLIRSKGFASYFLLVEDLVKAEKLEAGICGRGSGAASLVSYALGLSNVDPVDTNLLFERFLTPERVDPPDMDIDFAWDERNEVIHRVFERYGKERVAMVANHVFFKTRSALRAVALAHGRPPQELKAMSERSRGWNGGLGDLDPNHPWTPIRRQAQAIKGHFQQFSVHPGGVVITPGPLWEHVAFQPAPEKEGVSITAWDKDGVENYGLVKMDLLGNRSLAVIRDAMKAIGLEDAVALGARARRDEATQALLARGDTIGVFYVESPAMRQLQQRVGKGDFESLVIHSSLIRPAAYRWVDRYVKRARGEEAFEASHPAFESLLSQSHGVLVYQEDVIKVCVALAGWTYHRADQLRKALGKPDTQAEKLPIFEAEFRGGCAAKGVPVEVADEAWDMIRTFTGYSFCKPHSASYAQVSFLSAWIKAHHPAVFFAAVITNQGGFYPAVAYLGDARRHRLTVRGPDANASAWEYRAEGEGALRVGLMAIKGAMEPEVRALLAERDRGGRFASLPDLFARAPLSVTTVEALASAGAFDAWAPDGDRTRLLWERLGGVPQGLRPRPTDPFDRADLELGLMDLTLEVHPAALARVRQSGGPQRAADAAVPGRMLRFWALVVAEKVVSTERGEAMQFITFEDETGLCEAVAFPPVMRRRRKPYGVGEVALVRGRTARQDNLVVLEVLG